jgi:DNA helicase-2/ATP-dependent DNA helicase PcrA
VINASDVLFSKELMAMKDDGKKPVYIEVFDDYEQAEFITQRILELREDGMELKDMAVLFRAGSHSNQLEVTLQQASIPFKKFGGFKFTETAHIKDALAYVRVMINRDDQLSWHRVLQQYEGVGPSLSQKIIDYMLDTRGDITTMDFKPFVKKAAYDDLLALKQLVYMANLEQSPTDLLTHVVDYYGPVLKQNYDDFHKREQDLQSLITISERFRSIHSMVDNFTLEPPEVSQVDAEAVGDDDEYLVLSTIHSAKGLEWQAVFVLSLVDGYLPSVRALSDPVQIEEERRLLYVALTRAKDQLYLLKPNLDAPGQYYPTGGMGFSQCCRFLTPEMIEAYCDQWVIGGNGDDSDDQNFLEPTPKYSL